MKVFFLARIAGQLFAVEKEYVAGVGISQPGQTARAEDDGKIYLPLPDGKKAEVLPLSSLMGDMGTFQKPKQEHYLILESGNHRYIALLMQGKGRLFMADANEFCPLPLAFPDEARSLIPGGLINGKDVILSLNPAILPALAVN